VGRARDVAKSASAHRRNPRELSEVPALSRFPETMRAPSGAQNGGSSMGQGARGPPGRPDPRYNPRPVTRGYPARPLPDDSLI